MPPAMIRAIGEIWAEILLADLERRPPPAALLARPTPVLHNSDISQSGGSDAPPKRTRPKRHPIS